MNMVCEKKCDFNVRGFIACQRNIKVVKYNKKGSYFRNGLTKKDILKKIIYFYDTYGVFLNSDIRSTFATYYLRFAV